MGQKERDIASLNHPFCKTTDEEVFDRISRMNAEDDEIDAGISGGEEVIKDVGHGLFANVPPDVLKAVSPQQELRITDEEISSGFVFFGCDNGNLRLIRSCEKHKVAKCPRRSETAVKTDEDTFDFRHAIRRDGENGRGGIVQQFVERFGAIAPRLEMKGVLQTGDNQVIENGGVHELPGRDSLIFSLPVGHVCSATGRRTAFHAFLEDLVGVLDLPLYFLDHHGVVGTDGGDETGTNFIRVEDGDGENLGVMGLRNETSGSGRCIGEDRGIKGQEDSSNGCLHRL